MDTNTIQASFIRFQSYDTLILSKIKEYQELVEANPNDDILRECLAIWIDILEARKALLPLWNNAVKICHSL
jgi:hypothetical protein